ncbi:MAG: hypothetical protein CVT73_04310 [Alphaproteobacteria bacterium HGW-Alphaproteobacteria-12]|nr:MAG: hypothetical protein CVT73_04310 [Alphaproteobacteria bacterium HGW-Alphaproteobacteria-12]
MSRTFKTFAVAAIIGLSATFSMSGAALAGPNIKYGQQTVRIDGRSAAPSAATGTVTMKDRDRLTEYSRVTQQRYGKNVPAMKRVVHEADARESIPVNNHGSGQPASNYRKR